MKTAKWIIIIMACATATVTAADTQPASPQEMSAEEVARELANPNTPLASLNFKSQWTHWDGDLLGAGGRDSATFLFQPGFPFPVGERRNIFLRPAISYLVDQPVVDANTGEVESKSGFGDIGYDFAYGYAMKSGWQVVGGVVGSVPSGSSGLSSRTWTLGPELALAKLNRWGVYGVFPRHQWSLDGPREISDTTIQPIVVCLLGGGWSMGTASQIRYDWTGDQWTVPINLVVSKTVKFGKTPWRFGLEANYYVERSDKLAPEWMIGFSVSPVVPNVFAKMLGLSK